MKQHDITILHFGYVICRASSCIYRRSKFLILVLNIERAFYCFICRIGGSYYSKTFSKNHLSFPELLNCGTHCHPILSLNPTICHLLSLTSTNLIFSPFLLKLPLSFSVFPLSGLCYRPYGLSLALLLTEKRRDLYFGE